MSDPKEEMVAVLPTGRGGNVIFQPGIGTGPGIVGHEFDGSIIFQTTDGVDVIRFDPDGRVRIRGEVVDNNRVVYEEIRAWFAGAHAERGP
jgi:hypothetical protein